MEEEEEEEETSNVFPTDPKQKNKNKKQNIHKFA
jgi:hypothetical protein